jgi:hypothetical protein
MKARFVDGKKGGLAELGRGAALVILGILVGVIAVFTIAIRNQPSPDELEAIRLQYTVDYIESEQARLGFKCSNLRTTIQQFLEKDIGPILEAHQPGRHWNRDINENIRNRMEAVRTYYLACGRLYREAQLAKWDGLKELDFAVELDRDITLIDMLVAIDFCEGNDAACRDENSRKLHDAVIRIESRLGRSNEGK